MEMKSSTGKNRHFEHESVRTYGVGETIFEEGDTGRDIYIIQEGTVEIRKKTALGEISLAILVGVIFLEKLDSSITSPARPVQSRERM